MADPTPPNFAPTPPSPQGASGQAAGGDLGFSHVTKVLQEQAAGSPSPTLQQLVAEPKAKLSELVAGGGPGSHDAQAVTQALDAVEGLIDLLGSGKVSR